MRRLQGIIALGVLVATTSCTAAPLEVDAQEASEHQAFENIEVFGVPSGQAEPFGTRLGLTVSAEGKISAACVLPPDDQDRCRPLNASFLKDFRYRPFLRNGVAVPVKVYADAVLYPKERRPWRTVSFPATDLSTLKITLERGSCYGTCPSYEVTIDGTGNIFWHGRLYTVLDGEHRARIPVSVVRNLVERFAAADFYSLDNEYAAPVTDSSTHLISFSMGGRSKTVSDYVGLAIGMPKSAFDLEAAIDAAASTERWVRGTPETVEILKQRGFDFASKRAREMLLFGLDRPSFAKALISAGVPVTPDRSAGNAEPFGSVLVGAIASGDREIIALLVKAGVNKDVTSAEAGEMLKAAAQEADPELTKMVLALAPSSSFSPEAKFAALKAATQASFRRSSAKSRAPFNKEMTIAVLLNAGADPNRLSADGEHVLEWIYEPEVAAQLVAAGVDLNRRDKDGEIPLLSNHNDETTLYLMQSTKPGIADPATARALRDRAANFKFAKVLARLRAH